MDIKGRAADDPRRGNGGPPALGGSGRVGVGIRAHKHHDFVVVVRIDFPCDLQLFQVVDAVNPLRLAPGCRQRRQQQCCQNRDDSDYDKQFDQSKSADEFRFSTKPNSRFHFRAFIVVFAIAISSNVGALHNRTVHPPPLSRSLPSAENARPETGPSCACSVAASWSDAIFQSLIVPSSPLEASVLPSRENATFQTAPVWPRKNFMFRPVRSHKPTRPSQQALASSFPSGEKATP